VLGRLLDQLTDLLLRRARTVLVVSLVIVVIFGLIATRLRLDPDVLNLIPQGNREVNEFRALLKETGTLDFHVIVVEFPQGVEPSTYYPLLDKIGEKLQTSKQIDSVTWKLPDTVSVVDKIVPYSMLILTPEQVDAMAQKFSDEGIREAVARNKALLQTPQSTMVKQLVQIDPFNLLPIYLEKLQRAGGGLNIDFASGYYVSKDQRAAILIARPHLAAQNLPFSRKVMAETHTFVDQALAEFKAANKNVAPPVIGFTGGYAIAATDERIIQRDMLINSVTSMVGVLLLYLYAYRRPSAMLYAGVPMTAAIIITFGLGALTYGTLPVRT
jgi:predicted RND superfamily exporter protein